MLPISILQAAGFLRGKIEKALSFACVMHDLWLRTRTDLPVLTLSPIVQAFLLEKEGKTEFIGNRTECALLILLRDWGKDFKAMRDEHSERIEHMYGFSSERKMASVLLGVESGTRLYVKVSLHARQNERLIMTCLVCTFECLGLRSLSCQQGFSPTSKPFCASANLQESL